MHAAAISEPTGPILEWIRPPHQARTRETLYRLLDAAEALIAERGFDDAGIAEIARRANSSVGGFYRRFRDKEGLLRALHERFCEEALATAAAALAPSRWEQASVAEIIGAFTTFLVRIFREREGFFRTVLVRGAADLAVRERTDRMFDDIAGRLNAVLEGRGPEPLSPLATRFTLHVLIGTLNHVLVVQPGAIGLADPQLADELTRVVLGYLGLQPTTPPAIQAIPRQKRRAPQ